MKKLFSLTVDSGSRDEPDPRHFGSLDAALRAYGELSDEWRPFVWITEEKSDGSIVVHMRDSKPAGPSV